MIAILQLLLVEIESHGKLLKLLCLYNLQLCLLILTFEYGLDPLDPISISSISTTILINFRLFITIFTTTFHLYINTTTTIVWLLRNSQLLLMWSFIDGRHTE